MGEALISIAIGIAAYLLFVTIGGYTSLADEDLVMRDRALLTRADTTASKLVPPFVLVDVTEKDERQLDYPAVTPRALVGKLVSLAAAGHPRLIVIDIDLGWASTTDDEAVLLKALEANSGAQHPPILIVREPFQREDGRPLNDKDAPPADLLRKTPYDALVAKSSNIAWVSALAPIDGDGILRRYYISVPVCRGPQTLQLLGVQVSSCAALDGVPSLARLGRAASLSSTACLADGSPGTAPATEFVCGGHTWPIGHPGAAAPIFYRMRWLLPKDSKRPQMRIPQNALPVEEVEIVDALDTADNLTVDGASAQFGGRIVIIGSSAPHLGDTSRTSVGEMPGMMVIANAIRSAGEIGAGEQTYFGLGIAVTALMSFVTYLIWTLIRRIRGVGHIVFKEAAAPILNLLWIFAVAAILPSFHIVGFLFPQIVVTLYLVIAHGVREAREGARAIQGGIAP